MGRIACNLGDFPKDINGFYGLNFYNLFVKKINYFLFVFVCVFNEHNGQLNTIHQRNSLMTSKLKLTATPCVFSCEKKMLEFAQTRSII